MIIREALRWGREVLEQNEVEGPKPGAVFLLQRVLQRDKAYLMSHDGNEITSKQEDKYREWIERRSKHEPVWYITGFIEFGELVLAVNEHVLIPRPETELLVERILSEMKQKKQVESILDIGTGSGTIILSLAKKLHARHIGLFASDVSHEALVVAKKNAISNGLSENVEFREGDLFTPWVGNKFDIIVANLPYVPHEDMATLAFDLTHYEPRLALDGGKLGMDIYNRFLESLPLYLKPGGMAFLEIGYDQGDLIKKVVQNIMPEASVVVIGDYADIDRVVIIKTELKAKGHK
jgi:release factor glutamine methyltransferase